MDIELGNYIGKSLHNTVWCAYDHSLDATAGGALLSPLWAHLYRSFDSSLWRSLNDLRTR